MLPLPAPGYEEPEESIPSGEKLAVDWTLCQGHGLCADIVPELIRLGPDGYPALADAAVPMHLRGRAQRAVRRCPALALRIEQAPAAPASQALPARPPAAAARPWAAAAVDAARERALRRAAHSRAVRLRTMNPRSSVGGLLSLWS